MDSCGGCLMVLIAVDLGYFTTFVREMIGELGGNDGGSAHQQQQQQQLVLSAFEVLVNLDTIQAGINGKGNVGREARKMFKKNFQLFVQHVHSFLHTL
mmetsp:Transcript_10869/g.22320  ORF Transcript_10869/g.22320 Transcript_10869/m.22320 type:complete len:98 (+) Transcript_10869:3-296(+)